MKCLGNKCTCATLIKNVYSCSFLKGAYSFNVSILSNVRQHTVPDKVDHWSTDITALIVGVYIFRCIPQAQYICTFSHVFHRQNIQGVPGGM